jgi:hypothetical protein
LKGSNVKANWRLPLSGGSFENRAVKAGFTPSIDEKSLLHSSWLTFLPLATEDGQDRLQTLTLSDTLENTWGRANPTENRYVWAKEPELALLYATFPLVLPRAQPCSSLAKE